MSEHTPPVPPKFNNKIPGPKRPNRPGSPKPPNGGWILWLAFGLMILVMVSQSEMKSVGPHKDLTYSEFYNIVKDNPQTHQIKELVLMEGAETMIRGKFADGTNFLLHIPRNDEQILNLIRENVPDFDVKPPDTFWSQAFFSFMPIVLIILFIWYVSNRGAQMGNKIWSFGKSRAKIMDKNVNPVTFKDAAGVEEAKEELQEVIEFLKEPKKFESLGGKIPKGVLLIGRPGTGKTLLARAVAGEASVPFFSLSGSDFVEMFVGVGASRVRDLFEQARRASKVSGKGCIVFIDEIDAVGRQRFTGIGGGNDEREQTLNALLVELDGFSAQCGIIVIAATNRPDTLDPALLRPGRFDRQIVVNLPDIVGREEILKVHMRKLKLNEDVDVKRIAKVTVYFSGADLANVCNEAALLAARKNKKSVDLFDFLAAVERVTLGPEKKSRTMSRKEKSMTAYHEAGHALLSMLIPEIDTFTKVSIIPRGMAGGYTLTPPEEDKHYHNRTELMGMMTMALGGLVAEELVNNTTSTGVSSDLKAVARIARSMICDYGMSPQLGTLSYGTDSGNEFLGRDLLKGRDYSEDTARQIDEQVRSIVKECHDQAKSLLSRNRDKLDKLANRLIEVEVLDIDETYKLLGMESKKTTVEGSLPLPGEPPIPPVG